MKALIIAAGNGTRLRQSEGDRPKPLYKVAGLSLIQRAILSAKKSGITEFVIVIGYRGEQIRRHLSRHEKKLGVTIEFVQNDDWKKPNGFSVLKAKPFLKDEFILLMSDHIFDWKILSGLLCRKPDAGEITLAVDDRVDEIFDIEDATKVESRSGRIVKIGKNLTQYNVIDTGIFYCTSGLFPALERACAEGKGSLSEAIAELASEGRARTHTIGKHYWQDVDTQESLQEAERILFKSVVKDTDGIVSRHLNRKVSGWISKFLVKTPLTANWITGSAMVIGAMTGWLVSRGDYLSVALGGLLFQFASIYDGCDGEVAKLKLASSKFGEWLDTLCDNLTYLAFFIGVIVGAGRQGFGGVVPFGVLAIFGITTMLATMYYYLLRFTNSGSLVTVQKDLAEDLENEEQNLFIRSINKVKYMAKRDFFALAFMLLCLLNRLDLILILVALGSNIGWIVLLTVKRELAASKQDLSQKIRA